MQILTLCFDHIQGFNLCNVNGFIEVSTIIEDAHKEGVSESELPSVPLPVPLPVPGMQFALNGFNLMCAREDILFRADAAGSISMAFLCPSITVEAR